MEALDGFATSKKAFVNSVKIRKAWIPIKNRLLQKKREVEVPTLIYKKSNTILKNANLLSTLYNKMITLN